MTTAQPDHGSAGPPGFDQAPSLPGSQFDGRLAGLSAHPRLLPQGSLFSKEIDRSTHAPSTMRPLKSSDCLADTSTFWTIIKFGNRPSRPRSSTGCAGWRVWQAAGTIKSVLVPNLVEKAAACGLKSLVIDLETLDPNSLKQQRRHQNLPCDYGRTIAKLHNLDVIVNASFVFGMEGDNEGVFVRATEWAIARGIETATFRILTPYPGTPCTSGWPVRADCYIAIGTSATHVMRSFVPHA